MSNFPFLHWAKLTPDEYLIEMGARKAILHHSSRGLVAGNDCLGNMKHSQIFVIYFRSIALVKSQSQLVNLSLGCQTLRRFNIFSAIGKLTVLDIYYLIKNTPVTLVKLFISG